MPTRPRGSLKAFLEHPNRPAGTLMATLMREMFPAALYDHATLGRAIHQAVMEQESPEPARATSKTGRNEPCPCGSGRRFKKCYGASVH
jgi:uncharacterized protein YecA (UPF0149 family)